MEENITPLKVTYYCEMALILTDYQYKDNLFWSVTNVLLNEI